MKNFNTVVLAWSGISLFLFASSCTERIDMNIGTTYTRLVIYGEITTDTTVHKVYLSKSADYFSNKPVEKLSGAHVTISDGVSTLVLQESASELGTYETPADYYGIPGRTYHLLVENVDLNGDGKFVSDSASSFLPAPVAVDSIHVAQENLFRNGWAIKLFAKDPSEQENFYAFKSYINGKLNTDTLSNHTSTDDRFFNGKQTNGIIVFFYQELDKIKNDDTVTLEMMSINKNYMDFIVSVQTVVQGNNPLFSGPPANIYTNFKNGAMGFFTAYSLSRKSTIVKNQPAKR
ncbi:DUF4249 domain-containing protein [Williamwhitmania taraxaci]|uniref:DUF4249 domain-containing protein n=1 Tax=Williamwhitmania taraxaci TaxID=1640674 RepID=A0A1G6H267_9BACT|nr:DUF4249 domain-containing protein [Williamwhitmania taraxaci]SDB88233.1 protein of unknown function [Williamwhitmania taraxaci]